MATFSHIAPEALAARIRKTGLRAHRFDSHGHRGVFMTPVTGNFVHTHQWYREVQRRRNVPKVAIRVRIPDAERVLIGKYNEQHMEVTASQAISIASEHRQPLGLEVIVPRAIRAKEILKIYRLPKVVGWRYYPGANGTRPCGCPYCQYAEPGGQRLRRRFEADRI